MTLKKELNSKLEPKTCVVIFTQEDGRILVCHFTSKEIEERISWWLSSYSKVEVYCNEL